MTYDFFMTHGLTMAGFIILLIIITAYLLKIRSVKLSHANKVYIVLLISVFIMVVLDLVTGYMCLVGNINTFLIIAARIVEFFNFAWIGLLVYYVIFLIRSEKGEKLSKNYLIKFNTIFLLIFVLFGIITAYLPLEFTLTSNGYTISGLVDRVSSYYFLIFGYVIFLLLIIINRKHLPKNLIRFIVIVYVVSLSNMGLQILGLYDIKDLVFTTTMLVLALYFTAESQDRKLYVELQTAMNEAERLDELKTKFLLNMSHEIRTPLNTILGYSELLLLEDNIDPTKVKKDGENMYQSSNDLLNLINNILDVSRIESGKETLIEDDYKLENLIFDVNSKFDPKVASKGNIDFKITYDENIPASYYGDLAKIERVVLSLLYNALDYTSFGEVKLDISGVTTNSFTELTFLISNTGHAMKEELFEVSFDDIADLGTDNSINSNTLGIIISKRLTALMGGTINFYNEIGHGTRYVIKIKQKSYDGEKLGNVYKKIENLKGEKLFDCDGKIALVVDDNEVNLKIAKKLLERFRFSIHTCTSGQECLNLVENNKYDIIFLDHMMPGMDGVQTLQKLSTVTPILPPVVALTANSDDNSKNEYLSLGFSDYLAKPIDFKEMNRVIKKEFDKGI